MVRLFLKAFNSFKVVCITENFIVLITLIWSLVHHVKCNYGFSLIPATSTKYKCHDLLTYEVTGW